MTSWNLKGKGGLPKWDDFAILWDDILAPWDSRVASFSSQSKSATSFSNQVKSGASATNYEGSPMGLLLLWTYPTTVSQSSVTAWTLTSKN